MKGLGLRIVLDKTEIQKQISETDSSSDFALVLLDDSKEGLLQRRKILHDFRSIQKRLKKIAKMSQGEVDSKQFEAFILSLNESAEEMEPFVDFIDHILKAE